MIKLIIIILVSLIVISAIVGFYLYISEFLTATTDLSTNFLVLL